MNDDNSHSPKHKQNDQNRTIGLGIEPYVIPPTQQPDLKPIRLAKRTDHSKSSSTSSSSSLSSSLSSTQDHNQASGNDQFQCRPMRLGSTTKTNTNTNTNPNASSNTSPAPNRRSIQIKALPITTDNDRSSTASGVESATSIPHVDPTVDDIVFAICIVDFHHQRGPEVQWWKSNYFHDYNAALFKNLPFQALPDGSHLFEETFSNFNLVYDFKNNISIDNGDDLNSYQGDPRYLKTLFGCSCVRQLKTSDLSQEERDRNKDITRSIVQKSVVIIVRNKPIFSKIKEKLSICTHSYFQQDNFNNYDILNNLFDSLNHTLKQELIEERDDSNPQTIQLQISPSLNGNQQDEENFINLNLRNLILKFKSNFLIIFKSLLLEKKVLIYSNNNLEILTQFQNNLISLIPELINNLDNSGCPLIDYIETNKGSLIKPTSLNLINRKSKLRFFGLPLQIFNTKNSYWNPYLPLQQLNELFLIDNFMVGCSNYLFVNQLEHFKIDLFINLDTNELKFPVGKQEELSLTVQDKKFITSILNNITLNGDNGSYYGNDDYIRNQFEDYLLSLLSTTRFQQYFDKFNQLPPGFDTNNAHNTATTNMKHLGNLTYFNDKYVEVWKKSQNFKIWNLMADEFIFNFINPNHVAFDLIDTSSHLNANQITQFFNSFKFKPASTTTNVSASSANIIDKESKAQKFIVDDKLSTRDTAHDNNSNDKESNDDDNNDEDDDDDTTITANDNEFVNIDESVEPIGKRISNWTSTWGFKKK